MKKFLLLSFTACLLIGCNEEKQVFKTDYFKIEINRQGYITGMWDNTKENRNFSPADNPSPLLSLYNSKEKKYYYPQKASYDRGIYRLTYENGSVADVKLEAKQRYFKLTLAHLENREQIDAIQWGSYYTNIDNLLGEIIGVARDTSAAVNYAIGALLWMTIPSAAKLDIPPTPVGVATSSILQTTSNIRFLSNYMRDNS